MTDMYGQIWFDPGSLAPWRWRLLNADHYMLEVGGASTKWGAKRAAKRAAKTLRKQRKFGVRDFEV